MGNSSGRGWVQPVRRGAYFIGRGAARRLPMIVRRKALRLLVDSLPAEGAAPRGGPPAQTPWPRGVDPRAADAFAASLAALGDDRACELTQAMTAKVLSVHQQLLLRWRLTARVPVVYPRAQVKLHVGSPDELRMAGLVERMPWTAQWIERYVAPGHAFCDIGANVGVFSLIAARLYGPPTRVWAFEPAFTEFESLCRNVIANGCEEIVTPLAVALASRSRFETLNYLGLYAGGSVRFLGSAGAPDPAAKPRFSTPVVALALDDLVEIFRLPVPNHMRIGVDAAALEVLEGGAQTLADPRLLSLMIDIHAQPAVEEQIGRQLAALGFRAAERHAGTDPRTGGRDTTSLLYVRGD